MNPYIEYLSHPIIKHNPHFLNRLVSIIAHYKSIEANIQQEFEDHHIVPFHWIRDMGPLWEHKSRKRNLRNEDNFVKLPTRAHFICHVLYTKAFPDEDGLKYCLSSMSIKHRLSSKMYEYARNQRSVVMRGRKVTNRKSSPLTDQHKQNIKNAMMKSKKAQDSRKKLTQYVIDHLPMVHTPYGAYKGQKEACEALGIHQRTLQYRLKSSSFPEWYSISAP